MDAQELVTGFRWELLRVLGSTSATGAELARKLDTSAANVSQHLKLLELAGIVHKERERGRRTYYRSTQGLALITLLHSGAQRTTLTLDRTSAAELQLLLDTTLPKGTNRILRSFLLEYEGLVQSFSAFGFLPSAHDPQLLVIADDVALLRKDYATIRVNNHRVALWSHTPAEFADGVQRKDHYFTEKLRQVTILADEQGILHRLKKEHQ